MKRFAWILAAGLALAGCGGVEGDEDWTVEAEEEIAWSEVEQGLNSSETALVGAWNGRTGPFAKLVLNDNKRFVADRIVWCIRAPCPPVRANGTWYASTTTLSLRENGVTKKYPYTRTATTLTLKDSRGQVVARFTKSTANACTAFGGRCKAVNATPCAAGRHAADARDYPCGPSGTLGTMCCLPD